MQVEMLFHQEIETPLGSAVLTADTTGLAGFYFSDQRDYPLQLEHPGRQKISNPQAGQYEGEILRQCRVFAHDDNPSAVKRHALHAKLNWERGAIARLPDGISPVPDSISRYFRLATQELDAYFRGRLKRFSVPLCFKGTDFQLKIWETLANLPAGQLISYGELGGAAGVSPRAYRAVGGAVGRNPLSIIVPCHRVVASNRQLTGYGGGLARKVALLEHEGFQVR
ncbi:MAG TPA: hypothetical protein DIS96_14270 [Pusillimonas sp.]|nr:hypothetical protein [Pusillimonas sp.]